jgi:hypothetical protein
VTLILSLLANSQLSNPNNESFAFGIQPQFKAIATSHSFE